MPPLLEVRDLAVKFLTDDGVVRGASVVKPGRTWENLAQSAAL